jgi:hypothetical protein
VGWGPGPGLGPGLGGGSECFCLIIKEYVEISADSRCKYVLERGRQSEKFTIYSQALLCGLFSDATQPRY